jgi:hypothetical protein
MRSAEIPKRRSQRNRPLYSEDFHDEETRLDRGHYTELGSGESMPLSLCT